LKISGYLVAILLTVSIAAKAIGSLQPPYPALRGFVEGCEDKPQPCWHGIVPGVTLADDARKIVEGLGYVLNDTNSTEVYLFNGSSAFCRGVMLVHPDDKASISLLMFSHCSNFVLGAFSLLGLPTLITKSYPKSSTVTLAEFYNVMVNWCKGCTNLSAHSKVELVYISTTINRFSGVPWRGFAPQWRYCQLEPTFTGC